QLREALRIYRGILGEDHPYVAQVHLYLGQVRYGEEQYAEAETELREALGLYHRLVGEEYTEMVLVYLYLAPTVEKRGRFADARQLYQANLDLTVRLRGDRHPWTGVAFNNLAAYLERQALYGDAEQLYRQSITALLAVGDEYSTLLATSYQNLGVNLQSQARYDEAEELFQKALAIHRRLREEDPAELGRLYLHFAYNRDAQGHVAAAELLYRKAVAGIRKRYGDNSSNTAWALNNLAMNLLHQGRAADAEQPLRDALAILGRSRADESRAVAKITGNLATCLRDQGKRADAVALCAEALATLRDRLPADHPDLAVVLHNVGAGLQDQDRYADAERYFREALGVLTRRLGEHHPDTARGRANLSVNLFHQGRFDEADRLLRGALAAQRPVLGEGHPSTAWVYKNLLVNCCARGAYAQAAELGPAAGKSFEAARRRISFGGLDRAATTSYSPFPALAVVAARGGRPAAAWDALEQSLARGLLDDLAARRVGDEDRRQERELLDRLNLLDRRIDALRGGDDRADADRRKAEADRDAVQVELAQFRAGLADKYGVAAGQVYGLAQIQAQLPEDAALVAWVDLPAAPNWHDPKGDHWACLVRHQGDPVWVQLRGAGPGGAWTDGDDRLAARTRRALAARPTDRTGDWKELAGTLAGQRLGPLAGELKAVRQLIVLPSANMADVPLDALPGVADRFTVSHAPSGTMFAWLREHRLGRVPQPSLLALGDPAFPPLPRDDGPAAKPAGRREAFAPLPGTGTELSAVARIFHSKRLLTGSDASEKELDDLAAADRLREYRFLHFATHGVLDAQRPMRSALILAQDRLPDPAAPAGTGKEVSDGRLTAERILRRWTLDAELVTLSACDTGLGKFADGEGHLGFSQALFLAGAHSLVLSLWEVDDASTALLMTRFYENLLGAGAGKAMSKAEALAEAKRWLRDLGPEDVSQLTKDLAARGTRGRVVDRRPGGKERAARTYEHPYYWSGFILVGDPR
ncbi:MAG TPA: CHAT domain-containing tetratricopeptide repeat protein, partial [Gemmataceae bacterium]